MINFTAVMRYPGFCGGGVQTRNVNYCMAPALGTRGPLSQSEARDGARDQSGARDCAWEDGLTGGNHVSSAYTYYPIPNL